MLLFWLGTRGRNDEPVERDVDEGEVAAEFVERKMEDVPNTLKYKENIVGQGASWTKACFIELKENTNIWYLNTVWSLDKRYFDRLRLT